MIETKPPEQARASHSARVTSNGGSMTAQTPSPQIPRAPRQNAPHPAQIAERSRDNSVRGAWWRPTRRTARKRDGAESDQHARTFQQQLWAVDVGSCCSVSNENRNPNAAPAVQQDRDSVLMRAQSRDAVRASACGAAIAIGAG